MELMTTNHKKNRKTYTAPKLKKYGNVSKITLKTGSDTDGLGGMGVEF